MNEVACNVVLMWSSMKVLKMNFTTAVTPSISLFLIYFQNGWNWRAIYYAGGDKSSSQTVIAQKSPTSIFWTAFWMLTWMIWDTTEQTDRQPGRQTHRVEGYGQRYHLPWPCNISRLTHYNDEMMSAMASKITSVSIAYSTVYSVADKKTHQSSTSLAFVRGIHRWPVNFPHKGPVTRQMFPFAYVIMLNKV